MKPVWLRKVDICFIFICCIQFPTFIIQGIHRIHLLFYIIPEHIIFSLVYWFWTTIDDFYHDPLILLQEVF